MRKPPDRSWHQQFFRELLFPPHTCAFLPIRDPPTRHVWLSPSWGSPPLDVLQNGEKWNTAHLFCSGNYIGLIWVGTTTTSATNITHLIPFQAQGGFEKAFGESNPLSLRLRRRCCSGLSFCKEVRNIQFNWDILKSNVDWWQLEVWMNHPLQLAFSINACQDHL
jgi:hypothetical protein